VKEIIQRLEALAEARTPAPPPDVRFVAIERRDFLPILAALKTGQAAEHALLPMRLLADVHDVWNETEWANEHEASVLESFAWKWFKDALVEAYPEAK
jgi:hypothetical protein